MNPFEIIRRPRFDPLALPIVLRDGKPHIDWLGRLVPVHQPTLAPLKPHKRGGTPLKDISGQRFGRLVAVTPIGACRTHNIALWKCRCDCGRYTEVRGNNLRKGNTQSCGCLQREKLAAGREMGLRKMIERRKRQSSLAGLESAA